MILGNLGLGLNRFRNRGLAVAAGTPAQWAKYREQVKTLSKNGNVGHNPMLTLQKVTTLSHPNVSYNSTNHTATISGDGTEANPVIVEGIDFEGALTSIINSNVVIRDCKWDANDTTTNPASMLRMTGDDFNITIEFCTFSGRKGKDARGELFALFGTPSQTKGGSTYSDNVTFRRNVLENITNDYIRMRMGDNLIIEENWFKSVYQYEPGTTNWKTATAYAAGDIVVNYRKIYKSLIDSNTVEPSGETDTAEWDFISHDPHSDGTQFCDGESAIFRGNLMDATGHNPEGLDKLSTYLRLVNENGTSNYHGPMKFLGNVFRQDQAQLNLDVPIYAMYYDSNGGPNWEGPHYFEGNEYWFANSLFYPIPSEDLKFGRWGGANVDSAGTALAGPGFPTWEGEPVPEFGANAWKPTRLFAAGEQGTWYDPSDLSTMFQDAAGTTPVTAAGDPVGLIKDKSGNGFDASQSTAAARPTYQTDGTLHWLAFDGVDDFLVTPSIDFTTSDQMSVLGAVRRTSDATYSVLAELSFSLGSNDGTFVMFAPGGSNKYRFHSRGTIIQVAEDQNLNVSPITNVLTGQADISADTVSIRVDGTLVATNASDQGLGNYGNYPIYLGSRGGSGNFLPGNFYGLVVRGTLSTDAELYRAERFLANKSGVTI